MKTILAMAGTPFLRKRVPRRRAIITGAGALGWLLIEGCVIRNMDNANVGHNEGFTVDNTLWISAEERRKAS
jgi:hypothetical protein